MLQFINHTPFAGTILALPDPDGVDSLYTIIKATFDLTPEPVAADEQLPVTLEEEFHTEPGESSLKLASDIGLLKPGTDVLLSGTAYAPNGGTVAQAEVSLTVGPVSKTVLVFGDRVWESKLLGAAISAPEPFETMPLIWERAFGGTDSTNEVEPQLHGDDRNPVGAGFRIAKGQKELDGMAVPNLEQPNEMIRSWKDRPTPAGFAALCPHWEPRRSYAGTYDEDWQQHRAPYLPEDFDPLFFQQALPDQVSSEYLQGGEPVEILGATPSGSLRFQLPEHLVRVTYHLNNEQLIPPVNLDTVLIEPDESRLVLMWRTTLPCDKKLHDIREIEATLEQNM